MSKITIGNVRVSGIASAIPENCVSVKDDKNKFPDADIEKISKATGVRNRHQATEKQCASDLCFAAAEKLLIEANVAKESIDALLFVSQTPDYVLPSTACCLQGRLGLTKGCKAFDINLGCSGYVYGLWLASCIISAGGAKRALLLAGDTVSRLANPLDRSSALLFGDAGTATLLEYDEKASPIDFSLGSDGKGYEALIVPAGASRHPYSEKACLDSVREDGNVRSDCNLYMNGSEVFSFTLREVPKMVKEVVEDISAIDAVVMHQANKFIINFIAKKLKIDPVKVKLSLDQYGNTSSASIPLTISSTLTDLRDSKKKLLLAGFGVGFSWGAAVIDCGPLVLPEIITISE